MRGFVGRYLTPRGSSWGDSGTADSSSSPQQPRRIRSPPLTWKGVGSRPRPQPPSAYGNAERTSPLGPAPARAGTSRASLVPQELRNRFLSSIAGCFRPERRLEIQAKFSLQA